MTEKFTFWIIFPNVNKQTAYKKTTDNESRLYIYIESKVYLRSYVIYGISLRCNIFIAVLWQDCLSMWVKITPIYEKLYNEKDISSRCNKSTISLIVLLQDCTDMLVKITPIISVQNATFIVYIKFLLGTFRVLIIVPNAPKNSN